MNYKYLCLNINKYLFKIKWIVIFKKYNDYTYTDKFNIIITFTNPRTKTRLHNIR